ncbi:MAG: hypothetical protein IPO52_04150 [Gemmatimonadetes bacterium]|nr:hypothetical protein [Gemmatimonadota bacterium]
MPIPRPPTPPAEALGDQFYTLKIALTDSVEWRAMSPVVYADGKVSGWGWNYWEKEAAIQKIPVPPKIADGRRRTAKSG